MHVNEDGSTVIKILNQQIPQNNALYYQVRTKDHNSNDWMLIEVYTVYDSGFWQREPYRRALSGEYTTLTISTEVKQEFQVQAFVGLVTSHNDHALDLFSALTTFTFSGESSGWSPTQSIDGKVIQSDPTQPPTQQPYSPSSTPQPQAPQETLSTAGFERLFLENIDWQNVALALLTAAVAVLAVGMVALWRRLPKK
ncbi:MAG: hypothetical protein NWE93_12900 [Candidatus Bathyarchaeota archaeon]|nr:hypothetical protein [Candidatus Bathyarchaeota archaeon]